MAGKVPVITIDGPSGSGKGTISQMLAAVLGFHYLDSGALYRLLALAAQRHKVALDNVEGLSVLAGHMDIAFEMDPEGNSPRVVLESEDVSDIIRGEKVGTQASIVAAIPEVRNSLLQRQRVFARAPGLVADGRDMGTVVFAGAEVKIFLTASPEERARRRHKQLIGKEESDSLAALVDQVKERDERDESRSVSPLRPAGDAFILDSTGMSITEVFHQVLDRVKAKLKVELKV
ncbi:MAG TPA: (d)CMP kinase [Porticoccaceae bacterium]|nr:(d)CMP kinase [Porticoccaceae bacterium]HCO58848.1 (d)CMP kinase [Porticoccaceae bacterium]